MQGTPDALGERFRAAREARGLSLSDVADQIRIRSLYLAAIEEENWSTIGAPVYVRGFLRTYARFLGIDPEEAVAAFGRVQPGGAGSPGAPSRDAGDESAGRRRGSILIWVAGVVAVLLIAFVVYNELTMRQAQTVAGETTPAPTATAEATASPAEASSTSPSAQPAPSQKPPGAELGGRSLALVLSAPSWLRVTVDGNVSMEGTFPAGTSKTFHGENALVRVGNAGGVEIYVDGKDVGKLGKTGDVVEHAFTL
jgi:cytoskeletal protein RodZ